MCCSICDCIWENLPYCPFNEIIVFYHRANLLPSLRPIALELERFVHNCATPTKNKLRSKGVAMHVYGVSEYWPWAKPLEMNAKVELVSTLSSITRAASLMSKKFKR